jgi:hypothetical protein
MVKPKKYSPPCASGNALNPHLIRVNIPYPAHANAAESSHCPVFLRERNPQAFTQPARGRRHRASLYLHRPPWRRHSTHSSLSSHVFPNGFSEPARRPQRRATTYLHRLPWRRHSTHSSLSSHIFPNGFLEPATRTPQNNRVSQPQAGDPLRPPQPVPRLPVWDNHVRGSSLSRRHFAASAPRKIIMLNELEFAYTPVRDKVRDLREYL